ncbi:TATA box-binding protein-associated factor RNA polymerase I subunit C isoform X2 [Pseudophryne corroboree]
MDFPRSFFPGYYQEGPTNREVSHPVSVLGWGEHCRVQPGVRTPDQDDGGFIPLYSRSQELWVPAEPAPTPLLPPNTDGGYAPVTESDLLYKYDRNHQQIMNFPKQVSRFSWDHNNIAFQCMGRLLEPHCYMGHKLLKGEVRQDKKKMTTLFRSLQTVPFQDCPFTYSSWHLRSLSVLAGDCLQDVPPALLAELVNEGMSEEWRHLQFQDSLTGGALSWTPYPGRSSGCLIYPHGAALNQLCFQQLLLNKRGVKIWGDPARHVLGERIQQVSTGHFEKIYVGVRASFHLATFSFSAHDPPSPLQVVSTKTPSTCINVSPHMPGELCVCTEGGNLYLWNLEMGLQKVRHNPYTLFFRDDSHWRWSDFTAHPRVLTTADRTGVQAADIRVPEAQGWDLFRIGQESLCQRGERVILTHCLRETNPELFLVTTQFSLYIMDERFPVVPLVKWDHMLERPPAYVTVIPGGVTDSPNKILLGTQHSQETQMLQYSGGSRAFCQLHLPAVSLPRISQSLGHLAPFQPHRHKSVAQRLASPLAGLTAAYSERAPNSVVVFQLTDAGDLFTHRLVRKETDEGHPSGTQETVLNIHPEEQTPEEHDTDQGVLQHGPEPNQTPAQEVLAAGSRCADSPLSLSSKSALHFHSWICDLIAEQRVESLQRPAFQINKLFSAKELGESGPEMSDLRGYLRQSMKQGELIQIHAPGALETLEPVCTAQWTDPLSQRLNASWEGQLVLWWDDHYGLNRDRKIQALREKRRRQKLLKAHKRRVPSGTFTSSFSLGSDNYMTDDSAPLPDTGISISSAQSEPFMGHVSTDHATPRSVESGPSLTTEQTYTSHNCPLDSSQLETVSQSASGSFPLASSQSFSYKGVPRERRRTLQDFISHLGESGSTVEPSSQAMTTQSSQTVSQRSQPSSKRSRMGF